MAAKRHNLEPNQSYARDADYGPGWGYIFWDANDIVVDGTAPPTLTRDVGTDGQSQVSKLAFDFQTADDIAFINAVVPGDLADGGEMYLDLYWDINANSSNVRWDGVVTLTPPDKTTVLDAAGTALTGVSTAVPGTAYFLTRTTLTIDNGAGSPVSPTRGYFMQIQIFRDQDHADDAAGAAANLSKAVLRYQKA